MELNVSYSSEKQGTPVSPNVLYVNDNPGPTDLLHVQITNPTEVLVDLKSPLNGSKAGTDTYHFSVSFEAGALAKADSIALTPGQTDQWSIYVEAKEETTIYFLAINGQPMIPGTSAAFELILQNVGVSSTWHSTTITLPLNWNNSLIDTNKQYDNNYNHIDPSKVKVDIDGANAIMNPDTDDARYVMWYQTHQQGFDSQLNEIFIFETPSDSDLLHVNLLWKGDGSSASLTLTGQSGPASVKNKHFRVNIQTGTVVQEDDANHISKITLLPADKEQWDIYVDDKEKGGLYIYFLAKETKTLNPGESLTVTLQRVGAQNTGGPRSALVSTTFVPDVKLMSTELGGSRVVVEIENFSNAPLPFLSVGFETTNMVLCDGTTRNFLKLRIVNQGLFDIPLDPKCQFTLSFDASEKPEDCWALATSNQVSSFYIPGLSDSTGTDNNWNHCGWTPGKDPELAQWTFTPASGTTVLKKGQAIEIPISNIVTGHAIGRALLHVSYHGLHGYSDGRLTVEIQKTPLLYSKGSINFSQTEAQQIDLFGTNYGIGVQSYTTYFRSEKHFAFHQGGTHSDTALDPGAHGKAVMVLADGKVGIGTTSPKATLDVQGDVAFSGAVNCAASLNVKGAATFSGAVNCAAGLDVQGCVGIGTTAPTRPLQVQTASRAYGLSHTSGKTEIATYVDSDTVGAGLGTVTANPLYFFTGGSGPQLTLTTNGNLGIGTTAPTRPLQVMSGSGVYGLSHSHTNGKVEIATYLNDTDAWLGTCSDSKLHFFTNGGSPQLTLTTGGNLGIGTQSPEELLHVTGNLRVDGKLMCNGHNAMSIEYYPYDGAAFPCVIKTGYDKGWFPIVCGFNMWSNQAKAVQGINLLPMLVDDYWVFYPDVVGGPNTRMRFAVLFIRTELIAQFDYNKIQTLQD